MIAANTPEFLNYLSKLFSRDEIELQCPHCSKTFVRTKNVIQSKFGAHNSQKIIYCSHKCSSEALVSLQAVICLQCSKAFMKQLNQVQKYPNHFCSRSCAAKYNNTHKTTGTRRSKLEVWLETQVGTRYPSLEIHFNRKDTINSELDIYVPALKLAVELNGIFHYEPIYGSDKLASIKNNDGRKFQACLEKNIELVIIDVSKQKYFKEKTAQEYLNIICRIIDTKLGADRGV